MNTVVKEEKTAKAVEAPKKIKLTKPIDGPSGLIHEVTLGEPTFGQYLQCGDVMVPVRQADGSVSFSVDREALALWMEQLSGVAVPILETMSMQDANAITPIVVDLVNAGAEGN